MTDAEWDSLDLKGKLDAISRCVDELDHMRCHDDARLLRYIVRIGEDKLSVDSILRTVLKWGEEGLP